MVAVSIQFVLSYALIISAVLIWLNRRGTGAAPAAAVILALCVAVAVVEGSMGGFAIPTRQVIQLWLGFVLLPSLAVLGLSRAGFLNRRPWLLLIAGPISFVVAILVFGTVLNILFATRHSP